MAQQSINLGTAPGGTGGDTARGAFEKINANFGELYPAAMPANDTERAAARDRFGLGSAARKNTGTSGDAVPVLNVANLWAPGQTAYTTDPAGYAIWRLQTTDKVFDISLGGPLSATPGQLLIFDSTLGITRVVIHPSGRVSIPGYTGLGESGPAIKLKKLAGTTSGAQGGVVSIAHGLTKTKIVSVDILVNDGGSLLPPNMIDAPGYRYSFFVGDTHINIRNASADSVNILSKSLTVLVTYEE